MVSMNVIEVMKWWFNMLAGILLLILCKLEFLYIYAMFWNVHLQWVMGLFCDALHEVIVVGMFV
jgi:hypothetical protein